MSPNEFMTLKRGDVISWGDTRVRVISEYSGGCIGVEYPSGSEEPLHINGCYGISKRTPGAEEQE